jgi:predicted transposase/invertase (TIGR01784 family)
LQTSFKEGKIEGKVDEKIEIAKNLIVLGLDDTTILKATGLTLEQIEELRKEME